MAAVFLQIDENPNCPALDGQVFQPRSEPRPITHVRRDDTWCEITGLEENSQPCPAMACLIDDSGEGAAYLVFGGAWGLRLTDPSGSKTGEPYLLLAANGSDVRFAPLR